MRPSFIFVVTSLFFLSAPRSYADFKWTQPSAAELAMTAEPKSPGAPAIMLSYEEIGDAVSAEVLIHFRITVLTVGGLSTANVDIPNRIVRGFDPEIAARTIHTDGSIIPFTGTPQNSTVKDDGEVSHRIISLSGVEVGSILEVFCHFNSVNTLQTELIGFYNPVWLVQGKYFVHEAHFRLKAPSSVDLDPASVRWVANLPHGVAPRHVKNDVTVDLVDIPATPQEELSPPSTSISYNVRFFYYNETRDKYWGSSGDRVDEVWSNYYKASKNLTTAVNGLIQPTDTDEQKLRKIYNAIMQFENTDYSRSHSQLEDKKNGLREAENGYAIWTNRRGDSYDLTLLFIALARSAGFSAYPMAVASRNVAVFDPEVLSWSQLDSLLAIVTLNGHDFFFDPGTRYCPFGHVAPWHSNVIGVSSEGKLIKTRYTHKEAPTDSRFDRTVELKLAQDGTVTGTVKLSWTGAEGLILREDALRDDKSALETHLLSRTQAEVPEGVQLQLVSLDGLTDGDAPLIAKFTLTGSLGTSTKTRLLLPQQFFASTSKPILEAAARVLPIDFPEAHSERDLMTIQLPATYSVEAAPAPQSLALHTTDILYKTVAQVALVKSADANQPPTPTIILQRVFVMSRIDYKPEEYTELHDYFGKVATDDHEQLILHIKPTEKAPIESLMSVPTGTPRCTGSSSSAALPTKRKTTLGCD